MEKESRKASEVILELEKKLDIALNLIRSLELNVKIISNKLNSLQQQSATPTPQKIVVEAVNTNKPINQFSPFQQAPELDPEKQIPVSAEFNLPLETEPKGFRRTSRPETFSGDDVYLPPKYPTQILKNNTPNVSNTPKPPPGRNAEIVVPPTATKQTEVPTPKFQPISTVVQNIIPVSQRVVNGHGRSLFLSDVEIIDLSTMQSIQTRTNGSGKWTAPLPIGNYRIIIRKYEPSIKDTLESTQEIQVDGTESPLELQTVIIKTK